MKIRTISVILLLACATHVTFAQGKSSTIETKDLLDKPHKYWATSIVFKDTIIEPPSRKTVKIQSKKYYKIITQELGEVYLPKETLAEIDDLPPGREYLFGGTVLNKGGFIGKDTYVFVIENIVKHLDNPSEIEASVNKLVGSETAESLTPVNRVLGKLLFDAQASILVYAKENEIEPSEIFDPNSASYQKLSSILTASIRPLEREGEMTPSDIISTLMELALVDYYEKTPAELLTSAKGFAKVEEGNISSTEENPLNDAQTEDMIEVTDIDLVKPVSEEDQTLDQLFNEDSENLSKLTDEATEKSLTVITEESTPEVIENIAEGVDEASKKTLTVITEEPTPEVIENITEATDKPGETIENSVEVAVAATDKALTVITEEPTPEVIENITEATDEPGETIEDMAEVADAPTDKAITVITEDSTSEVIVNIAEATDELNETLEHIAEVANAATEKAVTVLHENSSSDDILKLFDDENSSNEDALGNSDKLELSAEEKAIDKKLSDELFTPTDSDHIVSNEKPLKGSILENLKPAPVDTSPSPFSVPHPIHF